MPYQCLRRFRCNGRDYNPGDMLAEDAVDPRRRQQMVSTRLVAHVEGPPKRKPGRPKGSRTKKRGSRREADGQNDLVGTAEGEGR